ncbi:MAG TPA: tetratricopeptide repeat protein, partial [Stellaceae bacterium]|nr:tetratricopeptide repeat protein [Stellaceae bacterium]
MSVSSRMRRPEPAAARPIAAPPPLAAQMFVEAVERHQRGRLSESEALYRAILAIEPAHAEAAYNLGVLMQTQGRLPDAIAVYRHALTHRPDFAAVYTNLGAALQDVGQLDDAVAIHRCAVSLGPESALAACNLGAALRAQGNIAEAIAAFRRALALQPDYDTALANLGAALLDQGEAVAALAACRHATAANPRSALAQCNLGAACKALNQLDEAEAAYRRALALRPDFIEAHFSLAQILLLKGDLAAGWPEYEWRWKLPEYAWLQALHGEFAQPRWAGEPLDGRTVLVYAEQGLGDTLQFVRFLPQIAGRGGRIVLAVQPPLLKLLDGIAGADVIPLDRKPLPYFDVHLPLLSLPCVLGASLETIPSQVPYLSAESALVGSWRRRLRGPRLKIGVVWAGNPNQRGDRFRSPHLPAVMPLFAVPDVDFVALQLGAGRDDLAANPLPPNVLDLGPEITDFADTAAIMASLDLVITSCT